LSDVIQAYSAPLPRLKALSFSDEMKPNPIYYNHHIVKSYLRLKELDGLVICNFFLPLNLLQSVSSFLSVLAKNLSIFRIIKNTF